MYLSQPMSFAGFKLVLGLFLLAFSFAPASGQRATGSNLAGGTTGHRYIMVDQFGYRPSDPKVAVIVDPKIGYNATDYFSPAKKYQVRSANDGRVVFEASIRIVDEGRTQELSGDTGYWFDFSVLKTPGRYYLFDNKNNARSHEFEIREDIYAGVLRAAVRMFFYNRSGADKLPPYADPKWQDAAAFVGPGQDGDARAVGDKSNPATTRDLRGGWFDAGDTNKYVNNAGTTVHQLLSAYRERPSVWTDDFNIPESGNGLPDLLDEILWEMAWLRRMQEPDGGVIIKVGVLNYKKISPPSRDTRPRFYAPVCSSSTITAAGVFAHAAKVISEFSKLTNAAQELKKRAIKAWDWYHANPKSADCDTREVKSGNADRSLEKQAGEAVVAAIYLYAATGDTKYRAYVYENYRLTRVFNHRGWSRYDPHQGEALLYFTTLPGVSFEFRRKILDRKLKDATVKSQNLYGAGLELDLYRAFMPRKAYHWGSNRVIANHANSNLDMLEYGLAGESGGDYRARALGMLHYLHGVNPQGLVYVSNMRSYGAEISASEIFHEWFFFGTPWHSATRSRYGPAPGYLVGGPNAKYSGPLSPPSGQPPQKSYVDVNYGKSRDRVWEVTEPSITYQAAYVKLLSKVVPTPKPGAK